MPKQILDNMRHSPLLWAGAVLTVVLIGCVVGLFHAGGHPDGARDVSDQIFAIQSSQIVLGMLVGLALNIFGMLTAIHGLTGSVDTETESENASVRIVIAGPGVMLILLGTLLVNCCVSREVHGASATASAIEHQQAAPAAARDKQPDTPPPTFQADPTTVELAKPPLSVSQRQPNAGRFRPLYVDPQPIDLYPALPGLVPVIMPGEGPALSAPETSSREMGGSVGVTGRSAS